MHTYSMLDILILHHFHQVKGRKNTVNQLIQSVVIMVAHLTAAVKDHGRLFFLCYRIPPGKSRMSRPAGSCKGHQSAEHLGLQLIGNTLDAAYLHLIRIVEKEGDIRTVPCDFLMLDRELQE